MFTLENIVTERVHDDCYDLFANEGELLLPEKSCRDEIPTGDIVVSHVDNNNKILNTRRLEVVDEKVIFVLQKLLLHLRAEAQETFYVFADYHEGENDPFLFPMHILVTQLYKGKKNWYLCGEYVSVLEDV